MKFRYLIASVSASAIVAAVPLCVAGPTYAQSLPPAPAGAAPAQVQEVIVTAEKREQNVQKVAAAVSVVSGQSLVARGVADMRGLTNFLPMAELSQEDTTTQIFIRGIGQTTDGDTDSPAVATNIDGVYSPRFTLASSLFDIDHVEVLSGPQGTLYGRNAAGGAVNVTTRIPSGHFESDGFLEIGNYDAVHAFAAATMPLSNDLSVRAAVDINERHGYMTNGQNDLDTQAVRLVAAYKPHGRFSMIVRAEYQHAGGNGSAIVSTPLPVPGNPWYQANIPGENFFLKEHAFKLSGEFKLDAGGAQNVVLTYIPSYTDYTFSYRVPIGQPLLYYPNPGTPGGPPAGFAGVLEIFPDHGRQFTNELRANGGSDRLKWVAGLYQLHISTSEPGGIDFNVDNPAVFFGGLSKPYLFSSGGGDSFQNVTNDAYAVFGQATYSILSHVRLTLGGRYSYDDDHTDGRAHAYVPIAGLALPPVDFNLRLANHHIDGKAGVEVDVADSSMAYATVQTGYIDGGFNVVAVTQSAATFKPETLLSYTAGIKNRFLNNTLQLNLEGFYYDYRNLQVSAIDINSGSARLFNVPRSTIYGLQIDGIFQLGRGTTFDANIGLLHSEINTAILPAVAHYPCGGSVPIELCTPGILINYKGQSLANAPTISGSVGLSHRWDLTNGGFIDGRVATHFESSAWALFAHLQGLLKPAYSKTDLSLTYHASNDRWSAGLWVKNIENTAHYVTGGTTSTYGLQSWFIDAPRTFGLRLGYKFN